MSGTSTFRPSGSRSRPESPGSCGFSGENFTRPVDLFTSMTTRPLASSWYTPPVSRSRRTKWSWFRLRPASGMYAEFAVGISSIGCATRPAAPASPRARRGETASRTEAGIAGEPLVASKRRRG